MQELMVVTIDKTESHTETSPALPTVSFSSRVNFLVIFIILVSRISTRRSGPTQNA